MPLPKASRRTLVVSTGLSPQVVTETLWALAIDRHPSWTPDEIVLVTTVEGARRARNTLADDGGEARIAGLARDYGRPDVAILGGRLRLEMIADEDTGLRGCR